MSSCDIRAGALVYTAKDVETYLSHLAHWYSEERTGDKDVLRDPIEMDMRLLELSRARKSMRLDPDIGPEFSYEEVSEMFRRLHRRYLRVGQEKMVIRPRRLIAAMRALRTKAKKRAT
jgi:hypothetical protein